MTLTFSSLFKHTKQIGAISPNGEFIAIAIDERLTIRRFQNLKIIKIFETPYTKSPYINHISWSPNSKLVLTANFSESKVHIWTIVDDSKSYIAAFADQAQGILAVRFSPMCDSILSWSEYKLRLTIWSLSDGSQKYIQYPKHIGKGISFHPNGKFAAVLIRSDYKDQVALYSTVSWSFIKMFPLETIDAQEIMWSSDGNCICAWDISGNYLVQIFNSLGILKKSFSLPISELGIQSVSWSPVGSFLALGSYDQEVRVLNNITWKPISTFSLKPNITAPRVEILTEVSDSYNAGDKIGYEQVKLASISKCKFIHSTSPATIKKSLVTDLSKPISRAGVYFLEFNANDSLLACLNANTPNCVWIWSMSEMRIVVVIQCSSAIQKCSWNPSNPMALVFVSGNNQVYYYEHDQGISVCPSGAETLEFTQFEWNQDGNSILLFDKNLYTLASIDN
ncbi:hypothetical protein BB560_000908 [Smittium megazygosporum]|uniref:Anaphase-promoting complex subunit 4 WD40 domain-containing protein n=1 Tax=Smittium megazygosporum TaxID=133381 RepID=A0A2T9ZJ40_9FUNG|nr:hypothetical protein BB560_000908 [Smittium megazygosporum]